MIYPKIQTKIIFYFRNPFQCPIYCPNDDQWVLMKDYRRIYFAQTEYNHPGKNGQYGGSDSGAIVPGTKQLPSTLI